MRPLTDFLVFTVRLVMSPEGLKPLTPVTNPAHTCPNFTKFSVHDVCALCGHGLVFFWRHCDTLCIFGFVDDVMFSYNVPSGGVSLWQQCHAHANVRATDAKTNPSCRGAGVRVCDTPLP